jgi:dethiobiotin synthetase
MSSGSLVAWTASRPPRHRAPRQARQRQSESSCSGQGPRSARTLLVRSLLQQGSSVVALKPVESGSVTVTGPDGAALAAASGRSAPGGAWTFVDALSPHLAARHAGRHVDCPAVRRWVDGVVRTANPPPTHVLIESAGGVFSPLNERETNFDLALACEPAFWLLVAPDALGVLHDVTATLTAMRARGRTPDAVILSTARPADQSTGSNAAELARLGLATVTVVGRGQPPNLERLLAAIAAH